jgi:predicted RNA-binding protein with PIN domain
MGGDETEVDPDGLVEQGPAGRLQDRRLGTGPPSTASAPWAGSVGGRTTRRRQHGLTCPLQPAVQHRRPPGTPAPLPGDIGPSARDQAHPPLQTRAHGQRYRPGGERTGGRHTTDDHEHQLHRQIVPEPALTARPVRCPPQPSDGDEHTYGGTPTPGRYDRRVDATSTPLVRPALELACAVAKAGERLRPPVMVPRAMRPLVHFSRLPDRALEAVRQVVDEDDVFRARVAAVADEKVVGRVSWLWLTRPEGWQDEIDSAAVVSEARTQDEEERRADRTARRRLSVVEASLQRSEIEAAGTRAALAAAATEMTELRQQRRGETEQITRLQSALAQAEDARAAAERRAADAESERSALHARVRAAEAAREGAVTEAATMSAQLQSARRTALAAGRDRERAVQHSAVRSSGLEEAVGAAALAAGALGDALGRAAALLGAADGGGETPAAAAPGPAGRPVGRSVEQARRRSREAAPRRRPVPLPGGIFDDSTDAAAWLVRVPGVVLVVDGYNVTLTTWSGRDLPDQRHRLVTALAELSMRTGAEVEVVFDGEEDHAHPFRSLPARRPVRVSFSPPGVDADEVIIERVLDLPVVRPVVVATDDRRVRAEVRKGGANVVSTGQLVAVLGRASSGRA